MANVILMFVVHVLSLLHQDHIKITYARISNFRMELVKSMPLYSMVMP
jgi:hypothetical protein